MSDVVTPPLTRFAELAADYCAMIEAAPSTPADVLLREAHRRLPVLYSAALLLPDVWTEKEDAAADAEPEEEDDEEVGGEHVIPDPDDMSNDAWMTLWRGLGTQLGDRKLYREMFAPYDFAEVEPVIGDLADDLADVYRDLQRGLTRWRRGAHADAAWEWQFHFAAHWGEHATSALRALHSLAFDHGLGPPPTGH